jgi:hypothetical protein
MVMRKVKSLTVAERSENTQRLSRAGVTVGLRSMAFSAGAFDLPHCPVFARPWTFSTGRMVSQGMPEDRGAAFILRNGTNTSGSPAALSRQHNRIMER